jgi:hypothetical protein
MLFFGFTTVLRQFSCLQLRSLPEGGVRALKPICNGKELKEFQLCDSRRLRKTLQDAQDDVSELFD